MSGRVNNRSSEKKNIGQKGVTLHAQARSIIYKVAKFFKEESVKDAWKVDIKRWLTRASEATGVSSKTIQRILREGKFLDQEEGVPKFVTPERKKRKLFVTSPDSYDEEVIRRIIIDYYLKEKARPSLKVLHDKVSSSTSYPGGITSLRRIVQNLGFSTQNDGPSENVENKKKSGQQNNFHKCYDENCDAFGNWKTLSAHYEKEHRLSLSPVIHKFGSSSEFEAWKENVERTEGVNYIASKRKKLKTDCRTTKMFRCKPFLNSEDMELPHGSSDTGIFCPAHMKVIVENEQYEVSHVSLHLGHTSLPQENVSERVLLEMAIDTTLDGNMADGESIQESGDNGLVIISGNQDHDYHRPVNPADLRKQCSKLKHYLECHLTNCNIIGNWKTLWEHYVSDHKLSVPPVTHTFETYPEFWAWKATVEEKEKVVYLSSWGAEESGTSYPLTKTFRCNRSGVYDPPLKNGNGQRSTKLQRLVEAGVFCPAHMKVTLETDRVEVSHVSCHLGYNFGSGHFCLPSKDKANCLKKSSKRVPKKQVLSAIQNGIASEESEGDAWETSSLEPEQVDVIIDPVIVLQNQERDFFT